MSNHTMTGTQFCSCGWAYSEYDFDDFHEGNHPGCDCIHPSADHDQQTDQCLNVNPTFGKCPCSPVAANAGWLDRDESIMLGDYHYYNPR